MTRHHARLKLDLKSDTKDFLSEVTLESNLQGMLLDIMLVILSCTTFLEKPINELYFISQLRRHKDEF